MKIFESNSAKILSAACVVVLLSGLSMAKTAKSVASTQKTTGQKSNSSHAATAKKSKSKSKKKSVARSRGQKNIDSQRAQAIQEALIREHYLDGTATGVWDNNSQKAMERFQADNNWQCKQVPDSRALIKLGLGPDHEHLLNPESAMTMEASSPHVAGTSSTIDSSGPSQPQK